MSEIDDKQQVRIFYPFKNDAAFDSFYDGMGAAFSNRTQDSVVKFRKAIDLEPENPLPYMFLLMSLEFTDDSPEEERKKLCETWMEKAVESGNTTQILRASTTLKYYKMTPEEREAAWKNG